MTHRQASKQATPDERLMVADFQISFSLRYVPPSEPVDNESNIALRA